MPVVPLDERNQCVPLLSGTELTWPTEPGEVVSLIPLAGEVTGIRTHGLRWPLNGERLQLGDTRGVSNEPVAAEARVSIEQGQLLVTRHFPDP